jgi:hypothetical protein
MGDHFVDCEECGDLVITDEWHLHVCDHKSACEVCLAPSAGLTLDDVELCERHGAPYREGKVQ